MLSCCVEENHSQFKGYTGCGIFACVVPKSSPNRAHHLKKFKASHECGTSVHLWLTLKMPTTCRIGDAIKFDRGCEAQRNGVIWLEWQPRKKGSAQASIPILPPLLTATRAARVVGTAYILNECGRPLSSTESLRNRIGKYSKSAEIAGSHRTVSERPVRNCWPRPDAARIRLYRS